VKPTLRFFEKFGAASLPRSQGTTPCFLSFIGFLNQGRTRKCSHPVQQEKQAKVTLCLDESVGPSSKEQGMPRCWFGLRFHMRHLRLKGQLHTRQDLPIPVIVSEMFELGLDNDTGKPR
jgi:hypothetical protein